MEKQNECDTFKSRAESPIIMSKCSKVDLLDCNSKSTSNMHELNKIKKTQEIKELLVESPIDHPLKSLKHLKACSNLQSTPNTRNFNKFKIHSETIMDLSPIVSMPTVKTIPKSEKNCCHDKSNSYDFSLDQMSNNLSNLNKEQVFDNRLKNYERLKESTNKSNVHDSPVLLVHPVKKNENTINEKAKRCLFENENANSVSNFENDQDSLNISLDVLEQVCQMSEMMDNSCLEEIQINVNVEKKNNKLASFLYGNNNTTKLDDTKEENELLQLALSMEDNIKTEIKSKNKLSFEGEFTSLNQLKKKKTNLSESNYEQYKNNKFKTYNCDSKCNYLGSEGIDDFGNKQIKEISNIAEPLESFDDQWTQQYYNSNASGLNNDNKKDNFPNINKTAVFKLINEKKDALFDNITSNSFTKERIMFKDQLNDSSATSIPITHPSTCIGFSTAGGKSLKVSDKALLKVQSMLKDELDISSTVAKDKTIATHSVCEGFSTAGGKPIEVSDKALLKVQSMLKDELDVSSTVIVSKKALLEAQSMSNDVLNRVQSPSNSIETMDVSINCNKTNKRSNDSKLTVETNARLNLFEILKDEEEYTLEDLSLIDTVEKFERDQIKHKPVSRKKHLGSPTYEINRKIVPITELKSSINVTDYEINEKIDDVLNNKTNKTFIEAQSTLKAELDDSITDAKDKSIINPNMCKGFSTAGGKSIEVSDKALQKVQSMLKDELNGPELFDNSPKTIDISTDGNNTTEELYDSKLTVTTNSKSNIFEFLNNEEEYTIEDLSLIDTVEKFEIDKIKHNKPMLNKCSGISTYEIDHKTATLITSIDGNDDKINEKNNDLLSDNMTIKNFTEIQLVLKNELDDLSADSKNKTIINPNMCKGFSTAGGKSIKVSNKALQKVQSMLKDELEISSTVSKGKTTETPSLCKGFSTARGKSIEVSDKALLKVQSMLKDELEISSTVSKGKTTETPSLCKGFSTARGKSIEVSDKALLKVQSMLKDELDISSTVSKGKTTETPSLCKGFSTAGGKSIKVSDKALQKVQSMLKDELEISSTVSKGKTTETASLCKGFSTAGGKSIEVSDKALQKVQSMLKDELDISSSVAKGTTIANPSVCKGFSTAGGKSIEVSDKALLKVQSILKDDLNEIQPLTNSLQITDISIDCNKSNEEVNDSKLTVGNNSKSTFFEILENDEECTFEDLSLIDTVEKFEKDQIKNKPILRNKRPGSPIFEVNRKIKKYIPDENWESDVLKKVFDDYLSKKLNGQKVSLLEAVDWIKPKTYNMEIPVNCTKVELLKLNTDDAINLKLYWDYELSDNNRNKMYDFQDIKNLFLSHNFVDDKLIPKRWIENHFCLIVWKLAATENSFPNHFGNKLLNAKHIILQLLYRYYREIEKCQRSALKKILEKDESATKRIILCVSKVIKTNIPETYNIELTDGWYRVQGQVDFEMNMLLHRGIVKVGTKLLIYNAELIGAGEGIDPLEVQGDVKLKISTNSTRRVRWHAKLGFYRNSSLPIPITLESVLPRGGIIGSLSIVILRKYPMMYFERKTNSKSVLRNEKTEALEAKKFEDYKQKSLEIISNQIETELTSEMSSITNKSKKCFLSLKKENLDKLSIDELSNIIENSTDPVEIQSLLSQDKLDAISNFKISEQERFYNELQTRINRVFNDQFKDARKVTPLFKLRVVDGKYASTGFKSAILTMWNPSEDVTSMLNKSNEGQCCKFHHLTVNGFKNGVLQISANKNTRFNFQGFKNDYAKRDVINFKSIWSGAFLPLFGELDFVGIVVSNINKNNNNYDELYVSDQEMNIVSILFQSDIKEYGCDDMMYPGNIISGTNIQFRGFNSTSSLPKLYNTEYSSFTTVPKTEHISKIFNEYKMFMKKSENQDFLKCCQGKLSEICNENVESTMITDESLKPQCSNTSKNTLHKSHEELPINVVKNLKTSQSEYSPAQKRIKLLNTSYGRTPPLNIIHTKAPDKKLMSQFKTPSRL